MSYVSDAQQALAEDAKNYPDDEDLARLYTLLVLVKGEECTLEDVHDAWSVWYEKSQPWSRISLVPFDQLSSRERELNRPFMEAIHKAAAWLEESKTPLPPEPDLYSVVQVSLMGQMRPTIFQRFPGGWLRMTSRRYSSSPDIEFRTWAALHGLGVPVLLAAPSSAR